MLINENAPVNIKTVQQLLQCSTGTASNRINLIRTALNKPYPKIITIKEFREYNFN